MIFDRWMSLVCELSLFLVVLPSGDFPLYVFLVPCFHIHWMNRFKSNFTIIRRRTVCRWVVQCGGHILFTFFANRLISEYIVLLSWIIKSLKIILQINFSVKGALIYYVLLKFTYFIYWRFVLFIFLFNFWHSRIDRWHHANGAELMRHVVYAALRYSAFCKRVLMSIIATRKLVTETYNFLHRWTENIK